MSTNAVVLLLSVTLAVTLMLPPRRTAPALVLAASVQVGCAGGAAVGVGTTGVAVGGTLVAVGGTVVAVGGSAVAVGGAADCCGPRSVFPLAKLAAAFMSVPRRSPVFSGLQ